MKTEQIKPNKFKIIYPNILRWLFLVCLFIAGTGELSLLRWGIPFKCGQKVENMVFFIFLLSIPALVFIKSARPKRTSLDLPISVFIFFQLLSAVLHPAGLKFFTKISSWIMVYYIIAGLYKDNIWQKRLIYTFLLSAATTFFSGVFGFFNGIYLPTAAKRILTAYRHPDTTAFIANTACMLSLSIFLFVKRKTEQFFHILVLSASITCLILTFSRTGWIAFVVSILFLLVTERKKKLGFFAAAGLIILITASLAVSKNIRQKSSALIHPLNTTNVKNRIVYWESALKMIHLHPICGIGLGQKQFMKKYPLYMVRDTGEKPIHSHNTYLHIGATAGIGGLAGFLWILITAFISIKRKIQFAKQDSFQKGLYIGVFTSLISFSVGFIAECPLYFQNAMAVFWILLAISGIKTISIIPER